jgi:type III secretory pathway lipoprotein EscJ
MGVDHGRLVALALLLVGCDVTLARSLPQTEAEAWQRGLDRAGVAARLEPVPGDGSSTAPRMRIEVARTALPEALAWAFQDRERGRETNDPAGPPSEAPLIESRAQERAREAAALARELERSLEALPGVTRARVHLILASSSAGLPEVASPARASVLLVRATARDSDAHARVAGRGSPVAAQARALVAGAVPGLAGSAVSVVESAAASSSPEPLRLQHVGPIAVTRASAPALRALMVGSLILHIVLASALLWPLARRHRKRRSEPHASHDSAR